MNIKRSIQQKAISIFFYEILRSIDEKHASIGEKKMSFS